ncbi:ribonucleoprotein PTB-binding 2 [Lates japonicus]|uniref:Ribonucleoprotein PTB-binding 2 n=1 Tax=Lates japonicus TaxID=270547 RepID=A0AAD3NFR7_LATJO|nr:ribonucleoprotein PTB-binding 2 [Lates japonicus]
MSPPPAFVTLLNGDQAQDAIRSLHHSTVRGRLINVTLQPTDSLLCLTNLPHTFTAQQFEELVRSYGNIERSFLVYSDLTGHSKGYGFVEYMKKDSASRARSELLGRPLGDRSLMVQWMDVNQLSQEENLHSKCLCVDRLPLDLCDSEELTQLFSETYKPVFCQLAQDEGSPVRGFGVVEYESAEQAEAVLIEMDRTLVGGQEVRLSLCTPGTSGRSTLAALIAAQGPSLSGTRPGFLMQKAFVSLTSGPRATGEKALPGDSPTELGQESVPASTHNAVVVSAAGVMPYLSGQPAPPGTMVSSQMPRDRGYSLGINNSGLGPPKPRKIYTSTAQHSKRRWLPLAGLEAMQQWYQHYQAAQAHTYSAAAPQDSTATDYSKEHTQAPPVSSYGDYSSYMQAVTQYYSQPATANQAYASKTCGASGSLCMLSVTVQSTAGPSHQPLPCSPAYASLPLMLASNFTPSGGHPNVRTHCRHWTSEHLPHNQTRGHKREYPQLAVQEVTSSDGAYIGQHSQGLGQYADYFKRKRLYHEPKPKSLKLWGGTNSIC